MLLRSLFAGFLLTLLASESGIARSAPTMCGTQPHSRWNARLLHQANEQRMSKEAGRAAVQTSVLTDSGNIARLSDVDGVVSRRNLFSLENRQLRFTRVEDSGYRFVAETASFDVRGNSAPPLNDIGDDDTRQVSLPFAFPFYGGSHRDVWVNSDGNLTFGAGDPSISERGLGRFAAGAPRIAGFFRDLDPSAAGSITVFSSAELFMVSWINVPEFGSNRRVNLQLRLTPNGNIDIAFSTVNSLEAITGISPGSNLGNTRLVTLNSGGGDELFSGSIGERFSLVEAVDLVASVRKFYQNHDDAYDFIFVYNALNLQASEGAVAFMVTVRGQNEGINDTILDDGALYGSAKRLKGVINMGPLNQYPVNPTGLVPARGTVGDTPLSVLAHEAGHLWLSFVSVVENNRPPMLNQSNFVHWNFTFNSEASLMEGNRIRDNGQGVFPRFSTTAAVQEFAPLDQYLMGFRAAEETPPTFFVRNATTRQTFPRVGVNFDGERRDVAVQELIDIYGRRTPDHTVSQRRWRFAFIVVGTGDTVPTVADIAQVEGYRSLFGAYFQRVTGDRATADTRLLRDVNLSLEPAAGLIVGQSQTATASVANAVAEPVTINLRSQNGALEIPPSVRIAAGQRTVSFPVRAVRAGVDTLVAEPTDASFSFTEAKVQARDGSGQLAVQPISGTAQLIANPGLLPEPVVVQLRDINRLPYSGQPISVRVIGGGTVDPVQPVTDASGFAVVRWTTGAAASQQLQFSSNQAAGLNVFALGQANIADGDAIVNGASFAAGMVPGSLASLFAANVSRIPFFASGTLPLTLNRTRILINERQVPLIYVSPLQANFLVPEDIVGDTASLVVENELGRSNAVNVRVLRHQPGIFFDQSNNAAAALVNSTGRRTWEQPIAAGEIMEIYATGLGPVNANGLSVPVSVTVGGQNAEVLFAGLAPGFSGLYQINIRVSAGTPSGNQALQITQGSVRSNTPLVRVR
jgi:uncharacterized protein (TIGR03437 family)